MDPGVDLDRWRSRLGQQRVAFDLHDPGPDRPLGGSTQNDAGGDVELAAMAGAGDRRAVERAVGE
jgi:hypothetical protein